MRCRTNERLADACVTESDSYGGGGSVMVWGGISARYHTDLIIVDQNITGAKYSDNILAAVVRPFLQAHPQVNEFQHDNASPHTAEISRDYLVTNNINTMEWPSNSPDLSPIENL